MMALSGVRSSWLIIARNCDFARLPASASPRACSAIAIRLRLSNRRLIDSSTMRLSRCPKVIAATRTMISGMASPAWCGSPLANALTMNGVSASTTIG